jgi:hypothetical protein
MAFGLGLWYSRPDVESFEPFFRTWFLKEYFPKVKVKVARIVQRRLKAKAAKDQKESNIFFRALSSIKTCVVGNEPSEAEWCEFWVKHCFPPRVFDYWMMRVLVINMGTSEKPCMVKFWGFFDTWLLAPDMAIDDIVDNLSLVECAEHSPCPPDGPEQREQ